MNEMYLNESDLKSVLKTLKKFNADHFKLIRYGESSGIGYCLDVEIEHEMYDTTVTTRVPVVTVGDW